jgi:hypothetical protein
MSDDVNKIDKVWTPPPPLFFVILILIGGSGLFLLRYFEERARNLNTTQWSKPIAKEDLYKIEPMNIWYVVPQKCVHCGKDPVKP